MHLHASTFPFCRNHPLHWPLEHHPLALKRNPADEAYWFGWRHSFGSQATIRVARIGNMAAITRTYQHFGPDERRQRGALLTNADWIAVEDAIIAANFWSLDERIPFDMGCDGADWIVAGVRWRDFHHIKRWSPHNALYDLGRLMFDLSGLHEVRL